MEYQNENKISQPSAKADNQGQNFPNMPPQNSNRNRKIIIGVLVIFLILVVGAIGFYILKNDKSISENEQVVSTNNQNLLPTFQNFTSGKTVIYYNQTGIFQFNSKTQHKIQLITLSVMSYGNPVLSPDNTKIVFYTGTDKHDLWVYDLISEKSQKLLTNIELYPGYIQTPVWAKNSKTVFISFTENGMNKLYSIDLTGNKSQVGQNYSGNAFWPKVINDDFLAFNTGLPNGNTVGIADIKNNKIYLFDTPTTAYFAEVKKFNDSSFLKVGSPGLSSVGAIDKTKIFGLEKFELSNSRVETLSIPTEVKIESDFKRIQPMASCGDKILLGQVVVDKGQNSSFGESYNKFYVLNAENRSIKELNISAKNNAVSAFKGVQCDINPNISKAYFQNDFNESDPISITMIDLLNPDNTQTISYSDLLPQSIKEIINNGCVYSTVEIASNGNDSDFIYVNLNSDVFRPDENKCNQSEVVPIAGIYRLSKKENSISKLVDDGENFLIVPTF